MIRKFINVFIFILLTTIIAAVSTEEVLRIYQESYNGKTYKLFYGQKLNWGDAFVACKAENAEILSIDSISELVFIRQFINNAGIENVTSEYFWTSGSDNYNEGNHIWMSNGRDVLKTIWVSGQPDNDGGNENCDHLWYINGMFSLNDVQCNRTMNFICEIDNGGKQYISAQ